MNQSQTIIAQNIIDIQIRSINTKYIKIKKNLKIQKK